MEIIVWQYQFDHKEGYVNYQARNHCQDGDHCQYHCWDKPTTVRMETTVSTTVGINHC